MKAARLRKRFSEEEGGFTLTEVLVAMTMMITVLFALYSIFDMSIKVFSFGNDKVEATENARVALEKMEREIRAAYPYNPPTDNRILDGSTSNSNQITFWNKLDTGTVAIKYYVSNGTLYRNNSSSAVTDLGAGGALAFEYYDKNGALVTPSVANEPKIVMVRIKLVVEQDGRKQELITNAALRNRIG
ncbi:MAG: hypothetical protein WA990_01940 [Rubrobacteraceae bacterium]